MISIPTNPLSDGARSVVRRLTKEGFTALWAGGCVRDLIMGRAPKDFDIATSAVPDQVERLFPRAVTVGKSFGVVRVRVQTHEYEVATFRKDQAYRDGRHPEGVVFTDEQTDALRRDFTVNALFLDPLTGTVRDYVGGQADLAARLIRAVGRADDRFAEDHLRMLRAVRFAVTLDFKLDPATADAIRRHAPQIEKVSAERIQQELTRILLEAPQPGAAIELLQTVGLLPVILPEVSALRGQEQPPQFHPEGDVWTHTIMMLNAMHPRPSSLADPSSLGQAGGQPDLRLAYAVLLHDVGKPGTAKFVENRIRFDCHAGVGAALAEEILKRLRLPNDDIKAIAFCIGNHMRFMDVQRMRKATLCRLVGAPTFATELELHRLDCAASHGDLTNHTFLTAFLAARRAEPVLPKPWVTGHDILPLGVTAGREIGRWKQRVYDAQLEGLVENREAALAWLRRELAAAGR
ncbi:MAG: CCA tRNA nucleotidyltransferase [Verrucomicrobia bacterium]|nr:CCA tRNA nucleotidyltransferase [Verrucomicrobiota bacterium]MBU1733687.1 CCA tRNA nucleotidyltransferase [Verrucomicrobiota bacterium]MBU1856207.1 CCA tRNA nucleotidyltransferase [Verrucomicrobiota bacterium]